ncbi:Phosphoribosylformylglycinamidine cyclo-ligase [invertebrate metagenome]|uniref:Phosphoribosylformylglycinamidine cyclo-ligase n=1 Tax=invertebrate metagenome TaxID=1711999 RepID=A0A484H7R0_9ZZZZ
MQMPFFLARADAPAFSYTDVGVNIDAGNALVQAIQPFAKSTARAGATARLGGFGALFDLKEAGYRDPILVAATDGIGTKLKVARAVDNFETVGVDLVAMSVNDLVVQGAEPLFFLDYLATSRLDTKMATQIVASIAEGCRQAGCALIGGETAEMPGTYADGDYDLAGFAVGAVERKALVTGETVVPGDVVLGLASSGLHANGYSMVRHIVNTKGLFYTDPAPFASGWTLGEALLVPTRIYVGPCLSLIRAGLVKALAHITGGGLLENIPRVIPDSCAVTLDATAWPLPQVFRWLVLTGCVSLPEMVRIFNCGIGMVAIVPAFATGEAISLLAENAVPSFPIGSIIARGSQEVSVTITGMEGAWQG